MKGFDAIVNNITMLAAVMAIGFVAVRSGYIPREVKNALSKVIVRITLPLLILNALTGLELTADRLKNAAFVAVVALIAIGLLYCIGIVTSKLFRLPEPTAVIHRCMMSFGNVAFLGFPLIYALFGSEGLFYAAIYQAINDLFVWTFVVCRLNTLGKKEPLTPRTIAKNITSPCTLAFAISFVMMLLGLKFEGRVKELTDNLGGMTTWLSMLFIGGTLAEVKFRQMRNIGSLFIIVLVKQILIPTLAIFITRYIGIDAAARGAAILQIAVPSQTILSVLTLEYGGDTLYTSEGILITTICGLATMPFVYYILSTL